MSLGITDQLCLEMVSKLCVCVCICLSLCVYVSVHVDVFTTKKGETERSHMYTESLLIEDLLNNKTLCS